MERDWNPVISGDIYCSPACGAKCKLKDYENAVISANNLSKECTEKIGGVWKPVIHENFGWHWCTVQEGSNLFIKLLDHGRSQPVYIIGFHDGTPSQVSLFETFQTVEAAYYAQVKAIRKEADRWNAIIKNVTC